jgi:hypothetical protein
MQSAPCIKTSASARWLHPAIQESHGFQPGCATALDGIVLAPHLLQ